MKKFLSVALILATIFIVGCSPEKTAEQSASVETKIEQPVPELEKIATVAVDGTLWAIYEESFLLGLQC